MQRQTNLNLRGRKDPEQEHDFLSPAEAAEILRVTAGTLEAWRRTGSQDLVYSRVGRNIYYERKDIYAFMRSKKVGGEAH
jgi:predicted site-specific integrase-resolvase